MADLFSEDDLLRGIDLSMFSDKKPVNDSIDGDEDPLLNFNNDSDTDDVADDDTDSTDDKKDSEDSDPANDGGADSGDDDSSGTDSNDAGKDNAMKAFAGLVAKKLDVDFKEEEFEDTDEFIIGLAEKKADALFKAKEDTMPEEVKKLWENYKEGVPIHEQLKAKEIVHSYKSIEPEKVKEDVSLQKALLKDKLINTGLTEEKALKKIERYETTGVLEDEALDALEELIILSEENEKQVQAKFKEQKVADLKEYEKWKDSLKESIDKKEEIIPGLKLDPNQKKTLFEGITAVDKQGKNAIQKFYESNPDFNLVVAYLATVLKGDFTLLQASATTRATRNLKDIIDSSSKNGGVTSGAPKIKPTDVSVMKSALGLNK
jgi:hypothetical protein